MDRIGLYGMGMERPGKERFFMRSLPIAKIVLDFDVYPRAEVDSQHAGYIQRAIEAGVEMPPLVICKKTRRLVDGFHRHRSYTRLYGGNHEVEVVEKTYKSDGELFLDAIRYNASHGQNLTTFDRTRCMIKATELHIDDEHLAGAMQLTVDHLEGLRKDRVGNLRLANGTNGASVPLKRSIRHMAGLQLTDNQVRANDHLSGMSLSFHVNQILLVLDNGLMDESDELAVLLRRLHEKLGDVLRPYEPGERNGL